MSICRNFLFLTFDLAKSFDLANRIVALAEALNEAEAMASDDPIANLYNTAYSNDYQSYPFKQKSWDIAFHLCPIQSREKLFTNIIDADSLEPCAHKQARVSYLNLANSFRHFARAYAEYSEHLEVKPNEAFKGRTLVNVCLSFDSYERPCHFFIEQLKAAYSEKDEAFCIAYYFDIPALDLVGAITLNKGIQSRHTLAVSNMFNPYFSELGNEVYIIERASTLEEVKYALNCLFMLSERIQHRKSVENDFLKSISL